MGVASDTIKRTASDLAGGAIGEMMLEHKDKEIGSPRIPTPDKDYAVKTAADHNDMGTVKSLMGEHPLEQHFAPTGPRHPLGRGIPQ